LVTARKLTFIRFHLVLTQVETPPFRAERREYPGLKACRISVDGLDWKIASMPR
jgi:hypothetical protein